MATGGSAVRLAGNGDLIDGKFRLEELLGSGGFGEVWRARRMVEGGELDEVALKLVAPPAAGDAGADDWLNEVRAVQKVECRAVAPIYDVGVARDRRVAFICMQLLRGETVADRLARGPIPWRRALAIAREIAAALRACHAVDVMHCDLKPGNVFLRRDGAVFVLDFGVARLGADAPAARRSLRAGVDAADGTAEVSVAEVPGSVPAPLGHRLYGTPGYIAPERYSGDPPSPAGDVYALGVMLHRMIAGALPHDVPAAAESASGTSHESREALRAQLHDATVKGRLRPLDRAEVPPAVAALIARLTTLAPDERRAATVVDDLEQVWRRPWGVPDPPYLGLEAFEPQRAGSLAGRDGDISQIAARLAREPAVCLVGPSGCGKSSLAMAGVAARVDEELIDGTDGWRVLVVRPSDGADGLALADGPVPDDRLGAVVVVDQLEEIVELDDGARAAFAAALVALAGGVAPVRAAGRLVGGGRPVRLLATCRDDLFGRVAALAELQRVPERCVYTVRGVDPNAMADIVEQPAREAGFRLEGAAEVIGEAQRILARDASALPLVQFALTEWWEARDRDAGALTRAAWERLGGIEGALAQAAQRVHDELDAADRERMREVLVRLFRPDGTRVRAAERDLAGGGRGPLVDRLVRARLLRRDGEGDERAIEVVHEALALRWPPLHSWLEETRADRELLADLAYEAERWQAAGRPADSLWRGARLDAGERVRDRADAGGREFLLAARAAHQRAARTRRAVLFGVGV
ncbi:MAG TPA: serine/threonine-protein kinase, partial [Kofleriaceae bacterium]|nr:serine/threonine-protein kinase [Kofleriaceae bacterium]